MLELTVRFIRRIEPREGWLLWLLALALAMLVVVAADEAGWVPNLGVVLFLVVLAAFLGGFTLARLAFDPEIHSGRAPAAGLAGHRVDGGVGCVSGIAVCWLG